jgi:hypothetical protein
MYVVCARSEATELRTTYIHGSKPMHGGVTTYKQLEAQSVVGNCEPGGGVRIVAGPAGVKQQRSSSNGGGQPALRIIK